MKLEWMGRYRELVRSLIYYSNTSNRGYNAKTLSPVGDISLTKYEYQVLEYICEFEEENRIMTDISRDLGILQSIVTKITKNLVEYGLAEKYKFKGNNKSIILKPTEHGRAVYCEYYARDIQNVFKPFFDVLENMSDEQLKSFEKSIRVLSNNWADFTTSVLDKTIEKVED